MIVIVGAGLAGLAAGLRLAEAGHEVRVLDAADGPGGRMRSDVVDGFTIDRGFQVVNTSYPALRALGVLDALRLGRFDRGALLRDDAGLHLVADPRHVPAGIGGVVSAPLGTAAQRLLLGAWLAEVTASPAALLRGGRDVPLGDLLARRGLAGDPTEHLLRPFLQGVLLERELTTSSRFAAFVLRAFARGDTVLPAGGAGAVPAELAARLPAPVETGVRVRAVRPGEVDVDGGGTVRAEAVVVATDPLTAATLLGLRPPVMHAVTTVWHAAPEPPTTRPTIALDTRGGPIANSAAISNAQPAASPDGRALIATSTLGAEPLPGPELRAALATLWGRSIADWEEIAVSRIPDALPALPGGSPLRRRVRPAEGLYVAGDHRDTPSQQGALVSGRRAAEAFLTGR